MNTYKREVAIDYAKRAILFNRNQLESLDVLLKLRKQDIINMHTVDFDERNTVRTLINGVAETYQHLCTTTEFRVHKTTCSLKGRKVKLCLGPIAELIGMSVNTTLDKIGEFGLYQVRIIQTSKRFENNRFDVIHTNVKQNDEVYFRADSTQTRYLYNACGVKFEVEIRFETNRKKHIEKYERTVKDIERDVAHRNYNISVLADVLYEAEMIDAGKEMVLTNDARSAIIEFIKTENENVINGDMANSISS